MTTKNPNAGLITNFFARVADKSNTEGKKHLKRTASTTETTEKEEEEELNKEQAPLKRYRIDTSQWTPEQRDLLALERRTMHPSWLKVLAPELTKPYFLSLKRFLQAEKLQKREIYPPEDQIYSWSNWTPFDQVKVVIIGQDPYHNTGQAHGLCFSVTPGTPVPPSLVNIYKAIQEDLPNFTPPNHGYLAGWALQGVLLLNASLTVRAHQAGSHTNRGWETFTDAIIQYLNRKLDGLVFILWGAYAQKKGKGIDKKRHLVLTATHPSPLSAYRGETFFACKHFSKTNDYLVRVGKEPIRWEDLPVDVSPPPLPSDVSLSEKVPSVVTEKPEDTLEASTINTA